MSIIQRKKVELSKGEVYSVNYEIFNSTMELVDACNTRAITSSRFDDERKKEHDKSWAGVATYDEALKLMNDGWSEKVKELDATVNKCKQRQSDKRISFKNDVHGFAPIVPLAILGVPNAMINTSVKSIKTKIVDVYYNINSGFMVSKDEMFKNGQKIVEMVLMLENCGYRVSLNVVYSSTEGKSGDTLIVNIKKASQPLDLKRICFPTMHAAMLRVIGFDWITKFPIGTYRCGLGCSWARNVGVEKARELFKKTFGEEAVFIDARELLESEGVEPLLEEIRGRDQQ